MSASAALPWDPTNSQDLEYIDPGDNPLPTTPIPQPDPSEPDPDPDPDSDPDPSTPDVDRNATDFLRVLGKLTDAITRMGRVQPREEKIKVHEPDVFDGTAPKKLRGFLTACNLHFRNRPATFASDEKKILFILSYLKGVAQKWFEPGLNDQSGSAHWMWDYPAFIHKLETNFGPHDPTGDAEKALFRISMKDNAKITTYNVEFWDLASRVDWNDSALRQCYFRGLPLRLCTEVLRGGKPTTLPTL